MKHDWSMPHDMRYSLEGSVEGCPPNCPAAVDAYNKVWNLPLKEEDVTEVKKAIYISGPMRGFENLNHQSFDAVNRILDADWNVFSPAAKDRAEGWDDTTSYATTIRADIQFLLAADAIILLPGWKKSEGARFEAEIARSLGLEFYVAVKTDADGEGAWFYHEIETPSEVNVEGIDQEARRLVYGDRAATYGHPRGDFAIIAKIWSGILGTQVTEEQVALCMAGLKLARLAKTPTHHDSQVDTIGYMLCLARLQEDPAETAAWEGRNAS